MNREEALALLKKKVKTKNLVKHMIATEACMRKLALHFGEPAEKWALAGLLHDLDYDDTKDDFARHGLVSAQYLEELGVDKEIVEAIRAHPGHTEPKERIEIALYAVDPLTGLIVASALMHPEKKLSALTTDFVMRRFKEKRFAAGANREQIKWCEKLGLDLEDFIGLCIDAMKEVADELGL